MKRNLLITLLIFVSYMSFGQETVKPYKDGEWLEYKMSYSGFLKAGTATLNLRETWLDGKKVYHAKGFGKTSSFISWFFKVRDTYESYFGIDTVRPYLFKRDVYEGGHIIRRDIKFDQEEKIATVEDFKYKTVKRFDFEDVQDMISAFYYLRNIKTDTLNAGDEVALDMFFDSKTYPFKLKFLQYETLRTKFGKIKTLKFRPIVQAGRVFKESESVTIWVTADENKIPIRLKASLAVGSLRAELQSFKGLANSFKIIFD
jgi:hypothetical protein